MKFLMLFLVGSVAASVVQTSDGTSACRVDATGATVAVIYESMGQEQWQVALQAEGVVVADVALSSERVILTGAFTGTLRVGTEHLEGFEATTLFVLTFARRDGRLLSKLSVGGMYPTLARTLVQQGDHWFLLGEYNASFFSLALDAQGTYQPDARGRVEMHVALPSEEEELEPMYITQTSGSVVDTSGGTPGQ